MVNMHFSICYAQKIGMKKYKPTSAGRRGMTVVSYKEVLTNTKNAPLKSLTQGRKSTGGRRSYNQNPRRTMASL